MVYFVGELSESQKQEIERNKDLLLKMSKFIEKINCIIPLYNIYSTYIEI
jgi:hypothetical protein